MRTPRREDDPSPRLRRSAIATRRQSAGRPALPSRTNRRTGSPPLRTRPRASLHCRSPSPGPIRKVNLCIYKIRRDAQRTVRRVPSAAISLPCDRLRPIDGGAAAPQSPGYLMPTAIESAPARFSTQVSRKPASFIQPMQSAPVKSKPPLVSISMLRLISSPKMFSRRSSSISDS